MTLSACFRFQSCSRSGSLQPSATGSLPPSAEAAPFIHQDGYTPERFRDQDRFAFAEVKMEGMAKGSHLRGVGRLGNGDPVSEGYLHGFPDRVVPVPFHNFAMHRGRNNDCLVKLAEQIEVRQ